MSQPDLVVVGASLAGLRAVESARREGWDGPITLIGAEALLPYDRPPLSKAVLSSPAPAAFKPFRTEEDLVAKLNVRLALGERATSLDLAAKIVTTDRAEHPFSRLVIATGSSPIPLPGVTASERVTTLRTWHDAQALAERLRRGGRIVIVGAGFIGAEIASAANARGMDVHLIEAAPAPLIPAVGPQVAALLSRIHERHGVRLSTSTLVRSIEDDGNAATVRVGDELLTADTVVVGIGSQPEVGWLSGSGLEIDDGLVCDDTLRAAPSVYAAGDIARWPNRLLGSELMRLEHWTSAAEQGIAAGRNAARRDGLAFGTVPYFWSDWYGSRLQFLGRVSDEVRIIGTELRFVALYHRRGRITGAMALNVPAVMRLRSAIVEGQPVDEVADDMAAVSSAG